MIFVKIKYQNEPNKIIFSNFYAKVRKIIFARRMKIEERKRDYLIRRSFQNEPLKIIFCNFHEKFQMIIFSMPKLQKDHVVEIKKTY